MAEGSSFRLQIFQLPARLNPVLIVRGVVGFPENSTKLAEF
jgi:hypothetical protein